MRLPLPTPKRAVPALPPPELHRQVGTGSPEGGGQQDKCAPERQARPMHSCDTPLESLDQELQQGAASLSLQSSRFVSSDKLTHI